MLQNRVVHRYWLESVQRYDNITFYFSHHCLHSIFVFIPFVHSGHIDDTILSVHYVQSVFMQLIMFMVFMLFILLILLILFFLLMLFILFMLPILTFYSFCLSCLFSSVHSPGFFSSCHSLFSVPSVFYVRSVTSMRSVHYVPS